MQRNEAQDCPKNAQERLRMLQKCSKKYFSRPESTHRTDDVFNICRHYYGGGGGRENTHTTRGSHKDSTGTFAYRGMSGSNNLPGSGKESDIKMVDVDITHRLPGLIIACQA